MIWLTVDIVILAVALIAMLVGINRGFLSSLISFIGLVLAIVVSAFIASILSEIIFNGLLRDSLTSAVEEKLIESTNPNDLVDSLSSGVLGILVGIFGLKDELLMFFSEMSDKSSVVAGDIVSMVIKPPLIMLIRLFTFIIFMFILKWLISLIARKIISVNEIPMIGSVNKLLGGLFGILRGLVLCFIVVAVLTFVVKLGGIEADYFAEIKDNTILFSSIHKFVSLFIK
jgi:uncharacterized membrane protein required for colicin V production